MQWFRGNSDRNKAWAVMRATLEVDKDQLDWLKKLADSRRHGAQVPITGDERVKSITIGRTVVSSLVTHLGEHAKGAQTATPEDD